MLAIDAVIQSFEEQSQALRSPKRRELDQVVLFQRELLEDRREFITSYSLSTEAGKVKIFQDAADMYLTITRGLASIPLATVAPAVTSGGIQLLEFLPKEASTFSWLQAHPEDYALLLERISESRHSALAKDSLVSAVQNRKNRIILDTDLNNLGYPEIGNLSVDLLEEIARSLGYVTGQLLPDHLRIAIPTAYSVLAGASIEAALGDGLTLERALSVLGMAPDEDIGALRQSLNIALEYPDAPVEWVMALAGGNQ